MINHIAEFCNEEDILYAGADGIISKPFDLEHLIEEIERLISEVKYNFLNLKE